MKKRLFMDVHVLQTVPPSCINRDDTGSPKTAVYGGVTRSRVSSQAWKRAMRKMFTDNNIFTEDQMGKRTKKVVQLLADELASKDSELDHTRAAMNILQIAGVSIKEKDQLAEALFFISNVQLKALAQFAFENPEVSQGKATSDQKKAAKAILKANPSIDIALFGRMVASDPGLNNDASAQVAHSISTHKVIGEYDYFTAVDDVVNEEHAGAGHIGTVEFNSSTLYRYATVALHDLYEQVNNDIAEAAKGFVEAFVLSMPTGKQNSFANRTIPFAVMISFREDQPVNLVGAFEKPVRARQGSEEGYVQLSTQAFIKHTKEVYDDWIGEPLASFVVGTNLEDLGTRLSFKELLNRTEEFVGEQLIGGVR